VTAALDALASGAASILDRPLEAAELDSFDKYLKMLQKWQRAQRLLGSTDERWIVENVFLDSLLFLRVLPRRFHSLADVGSGAGLPGIPIKILNRGVQLALIESRAKRASFLSAAVRDLELENVEVVIDRVERYAERAPRAFDAVVMRCAGDFSNLARAAAPLVAPGGCVVASGPPVPRPLSIGTWLDVPGVRPGSTRRFALFHPGDVVL